MFFFIFVCSCSTEETTSNQTLDVQTWFEKYEAESPNFDLFQDLEYNWSQAKITTSEDGTETIIVPIVERKRNSSEIWKQNLYLYKISENNYEAIIFEIFPDKKSKKSSQSIDDGDFNGYISSWDLKNGFIKAAQFENNKVVQEGIIAMLSSASNNEQSKMVADPCYYCPDEEEPTGGSGGSPIPLREVIITSPSAPPSFPPMTFIPRGLSSGGVVNPPEYTNPPRGGGGGGGSSSPSVEQIINNLTGKAKCLNTLLDERGSSFVKKLLANFQGPTSEFDIEIISKDKVINPDKNGILREINGRTIHRVGNKVITIEISTSKTNENSSLEAARTILHEYIHADLFRKLNTKSDEIGDSGEDFKKTYDKYKNDHGNIATLYLQSMKTALKEFHKDVLTSDYNGYKKYFGEEPSDLFYEAMAWHGLQESGVDAWTSLSEERKKEIANLDKRSNLLTKTVTCSN
ncbi:hypothetical protein [Flavobacterium sp. 140616W15]|uniref:hypothetical protein n=1 Tax=Flavobacterium sp. 140616W15 TaxID=2478552 RepID=UPI000F0D03FB|nr:hypothetical protein [Flavobacterium sp. 140616W15]AYN04671.1 hypothetical protein EAG11_11220 [Flavobacterium sp. 140616W15]